MSGLDERSRERCGGLCQALIRIGHYGSMPSETSLTLLAILALYNVVVFCVYAWDKLAAQNGGWRIREDTLLGLAFFGGGAGAFLCQRLMRHKTRKPPFRVALPALCILQTVIIGVAVLTPGLALAGIRATLTIFRGF